MTEKQPGSSLPEGLENENSLYPGSEEADKAVWHESLPPADDFQDEAEPEAAVDDTAESEEEIQSDEEVHAAEAQKRGRKVMLATVGVVALVVGGLAYNQFSKPSISGNMALPIAGIVGQSTTPSGATDKTADSEQKRSRNPSAVGLSDLPETPTSSEADITAIYNAGADKTVAPQAATVALPTTPTGALTTEKKTDVAHATDVLAASPKMPEGAKVVAALPPASSSAVPAGSAPVPASATNKSVALRAPAPVVALPPAPVKAVPLQAASAPSVPASAVSPDMNARLNELAAQIETLRKTVDQVSQETQSIVAKTEQQKASPDMAALVSRLNEMEAKLSTSKKAAKASVSSSTAGVTLSGVTAEGEPLTKKEKVVSSSKAKTKASKASAKKTAHQTTQKKWVLRAATPDAAWVATSKESAELRQIHVGDTLPGVGKVRAINQNGASWEVVGSKGSIH